MKDESAREQVGALVCLAFERHSRNSEITRLRFGGDRKLSRYKDKTWMLIPKSPQQRPNSLVSPCPHPTLLPQTASQKQPVYQMIKLFY